MTAIKREQILQAIEDLLAGTVQVGTRIDRSRAVAYARNEAPALAIEPGTDVAREEPVSNCKIDWRLQVSISVYTRGNVPEQLAAPIIADVHSRLMADRTLGGLAMDIWPNDVQHLREQGDATAGWTTLNYWIRYRTSQTDLTA
jgi:hypothetical protein